MLEVHLAGLMETLTVDKMVPSTVAHSENKMAVNLDWSLAAQRVEQ